MTLELFPHADYGTPRPSLSRARELVARVDRLEEIVDATYFDRCEEVYEFAQSLGAHSVARAVTLLTAPKALDSRGFDALHVRANAVATRWLSRQEAAALAPRSHTERRATPYATKEEGTP